MKRTIHKIIALAIISFGLVSCFGVEKEDFKDLTPIEFGEMEEVINAPLGVEFVYDQLDVRSEKEISYEWSFGKRKEIGGPWDMESREVISSDPQIRYTFHKTGTYILRLKVDNGETILFKHFTLNVNSGFDEGLVILNNDQEGNGALTFIKKLTEAEKESGEREIYEDVISSVNPQIKMKNAKDIYMNSHSTGGVEYRSLLISTGEGDGNIYKFEPKTFEFYNKVNIKEQQGTYCEEFIGDDASGSGKFCTYVRGTDGKTYRYDLFGDFVGVRNDASAFTMTDAKTVNYYTSSSSMKPNRKAMMYNENTIFQPGYGKITSREFSGYKIINFYSKSTSNKTYVLLQDEDEPTKYCIMQTTGTLSTPRSVPGSDFQTDHLNMDRNSILINTRNSNDVYYTFNNKIYRWGLTSRPYESPVDLAIPEGEIIKDIQTNYMKGAENEEKETLLYVATYNPDRAGEKKGSLYVFNFSDNQLVKSYEGICDEPVKLMYKYRM